MYLSSLHLFSICTDTFAAVAALLGVIPAGCFPLQRALEGGHVKPDADADANASNGQGGGGVEQRQRAAQAPRQSTHWKMDDYQLDPVGFSLISKAKTPAGEASGDAPPPTQALGHAWATVGMGPLMHAPTPRCPRERAGAAAVAATAAAAYHSMAAASSASLGQSVWARVEVNRVVGKTECCAVGCVHGVDLVNPMAAGLDLCRGHLRTAAPFACKTSSVDQGSTSVVMHFCLMCRRVHAPPHCVELLALARHRHDGGGGTADRRSDVHSGSSGDCGGGSGSRGASTFARLDNIRVSFKTQEDPEAAMARFRRVIDGFASAHGGMLHAEVSARPGCTLLNVEMLTGVEASLADTESMAGSGQHDDDPDWTEAVDQRAARVAERLASLGATHGLEGDLAMQLQCQGQGRGVDLGVGRAFSRMRHASFSTGGLKGGRQSASMWRVNDPTVDDFFPVDVMTPALLAAVHASVDPAAPMRVLRSDVHDCLTMPTPPEGFSYVLRCRGRFVPLLVAAEAAAADANEEREGSWGSIFSFGRSGAYSASSGSVGMCLLHVTPTSVEGLGFIDLVGDADADVNGGGISQGGSWNGSGGPHSGGASRSAHPACLPLLTVPVFITPDYALARELSRSDGRGATVGHAPVLFNVSATLCNRHHSRLDGSGGPGDPRGGGGNGSHNGALRSEFLPDGGSGNLFSLDGRRQLSACQPVSGGDGGDGGGVDVSGDHGGRRGELAFHAAASCATLGWATAVTRVLASHELSPSSSRDSSFRSINHSASAWADTGANVNEQGGSGGGVPMDELAAELFSSTVREGYEPRLDRHTCQSQHQHQPQQHTGHNPMSESPETATDDYNKVSGQASFGMYDSNHRHEHKIQRSGSRSGSSSGESFLFLLSTRAGIATMLRAAASSGDSATVAAVVSSLIRHRGACAVGDIVTASDDGGKWSVMHAAAAAVADAAARSATREPRVRRAASAARAAGRTNQAHIVRGGAERGEGEVRGGWVHGVTTIRGYFSAFGWLARGSAKYEAVKAATTLLAVSTDPLAWVSGTAGRCAGTPANIAVNAAAAIAVSEARGEGASMSASSARRVERHLKAANDAVLDVLAAAVVRACRLLRHARTRLLLTSYAGVTISNNATPETYLDEMAHFTAAASLAATEFDGSITGTIAAALLSQGSSYCWYALRHRALADDRGDVSAHEAHQWLLGGAPAEGFPLPAVSEVVSSQYGITALFVLALPGVIFSTAVGHVYKGAWAVACLALLCAAQLLLPTRVYLRHHAAINTAARLLIPALYTLTPMTIAEVQLSMLPMTHYGEVVHVTWALAGYMLQSVAAPVGGWRVWEPLIISAQALLLSCASIRQIEGGISAATATTCLVAAALAASTMSHWLRARLVRRCMDKRIDAQMFGSSFILTHVQKKKVA